MKGNEWLGGENGRCARKEGEGGDGERQVRQRRRRGVIRLQCGRERRKALMADEMEEEGAARGKRGRGSS